MSNLPRLSGASLRKFIGDGPINLHRCYLLIALTIGAAFIVITPPFQVSDEPNHFYRAYQISNGGILAQRQDDEWGGELPRELVTTVEETLDDVPFHPEKKVDLSAVRQMIRFHPRKQRTQFVNFPNTAEYSPMGYIPQVVGIWIGRIAGLSPLCLLYLGRLFNFLTSVLLCWTAIKIAPISSHALFLIILTPMSVYQAASLSPDALTNALSILTTAMVLSYTFSREEPLRNGDLILLGVVLAALALCKTVYFPLALLYFIIPSRLVGSRVKYYAVGISMFLLGAGLSMLWLLPVHRSFVPYLGGYADLSIPRQFILAHPLVFGGMLVSNFLRYVLPYVGEAIGYRLGWLDTTLPVFFIVIYAFAILVTGVVSGRIDVSLSRLQRVIMLGVAFLTTAMILTSQFFIATAPGSSSIKEVQGRYFIPLMGICACLFFSRRFHGRVPASYLTLSATAFATGSLLLTLYFVVKRFYIS